MQKIWAIFFIFILNLQANESLYLDDKDWVLACDNTATCRLAGYQSNSDNSVVSVMFVKEHSKASNLQGFLKIGDERILLDEIKNINLFIDNKQISKIEPKLNEDGAFELKKDVVKRLINALEGSKSIKFVVDEISLRLSLDGFKNLWGKFQSYQEQNKPQNLVTINAAKVIGDERIIRTLDKRYEGIFKLLQATTNKQECISLFYEKGHSDIWVHRLNEGKNLVQIRCFVTSYNEADLFAVMDENFSVVLQTFKNDLNDYYEGELRSNQALDKKSTCNSYKTFVFDGEKFIRASEGFSGLCKGFKGGAWRMPTYESRVVRGE